jgi:hypothetical protein
MNVIIIVEPELIKMSCLIMIVNFKHRIYVAKQELSRHKKTGLSFLGFFFQICLQRFMQKYNATRM